MFDHRPSPPRKMPAGLCEEVDAMCHASQIRQLALSRELRREGGLDCGCAAPDPILFRHPR